MMDRKRLLVVSALGTTQALAWASSYYLPAIIADRMARDTGVSPVWIFAAFSISLAISGLFGPRVGRTIDLVGGRGVLATANLIFAAWALAAGLCPLHWRETGRSRIRRPRENVRCRTRINGDQIWETAMVDRVLLIERLPAVSLSVRMSGAGRSRRTSGRQEPGDSDPMRTSRRPRDT